MQKSLQSTAAQQTAVQSRPLPLDPKLLSQVGGGAPNTTWGTQK